MIEIDHLKVLVLVGGYFNNDSSVVWMEIVHEEGLDLVVVHNKPGKSLTCDGIEPGWWPVHTERHLVRGSLQQPLGDEFLS